MEMIWFRPTLFTKTCRKVKSIHVPVLVQAVRSQQAFYGWLRHACSATPKWLFHSNINRSKTTIQSQDHGNWYCAALAASWFEKKQLACCNNQAGSTALLLPFQRWNLVSLQEFACSVCQLKLHGWQSHWHVGHLSWQDPNRRFIFTGPRYFHHPKLREILTGLDSWLSLPGKFPMCDGHGDMWWRFL